MRFRKAVLIIVRAVFGALLLPFYQLAGWLRYLPHRGGTLAHATITQHAPFGSRSIAILACYPVRDDPTMLWQMEELRRAGFEILLVANCRLDAELSAQYARLVQTVIERPNIGRDFGAYRDGYLHLAGLGLLDNLDELLLVNDTIVFPLFDAAAFWQRLRALPYPVAAPYENFSYGRHLQSFMILLRQGAPAHPAVRAFWDAYRPVDTRQQAIRKGEVGFSKALRRAGIRFGPLCDALYLVDTLPADADAEWILATLDLLNVERPQKILQRPLAEQRAALRREFGLRSIATNPSHSVGLYLAARGALPLVKKDLLSRGTANPGDFWWLKGVADADLALVLLALKEKRLWEERSFLERLETDLLQVK